MLRFPREIPRPLRRRRCGAISRSAQGVTPLRGWRCTDQMKTQQPWRERPSVEGPGPRSAPHRGVAHATAAVPDTSPGAAKGAAPPGRARGWPPPRKIVTPQGFGAPSQWHTRSPATGYVRTQCCCGMGRRYSPGPSSVSASDSPSTSLPIHAVPTRERRWRYGCGSTWHWSPPRPRRHASSSTGDTSASRTASPSSSQRL